MKGPDVNIRTSADLDQSANIFATSRDDGIYRNGKRIASLGYKFTYVKTVSSDDGRFLRVTGLGHTLYIFADLGRFV